MTDQDVSFSQFDLACPLPTDVANLRLYAVNPALKKVWWISNSLWFWPLILGSILGGMLLTKWLFLLSAMLLCVYGWRMCLVKKRVANQGWGLDQNNIYYRSGTLVLTYHTIPLARMQDVRVEHGPLMSRYGLGKLVIQTGSLAAIEITGLDQSTLNHMAQQVVELAEIDLAGL